MIKFTVRTLVLSAFSLVFSTALAEPPEWSGSPDHDLKIATLPASMRFDKTDMTVAPGAKVKLTVSNPDDLEHNWVLIDNDPEDPEGNKFAEACILLGAKGLELAWTVESPRVLAKSGMIGLKEEKVIYFEAPEKPGKYLYLCTFPGHATLMRGTIFVEKEQSPFTDLSYKVYEGTFPEMPDFNELKPIREGKAEFLDVDDLVGDSDGMAVVWEGTFEVTEEWGKREFVLASDDGSILAIDGETLIDHGGVHALTSRKASIELKPGTHTMRVAYFENAGDQALHLHAARKGKRDILFSKEPSPLKKAKKVEYEPIYLKPANEGEAITHRTFLEGSSPRTIAVGYPGGINLAWNADTFNLSYLWRGGFINVGNHWNGRGFRSDIAGYDVITPVKGFALQVLASPSTPWINTTVEQVEAIQYKKPDKPSYTMNLLKGHSDYEFVNYRLDSRRYPTFRYRFQSLGVTETFEPVKDQEIETITRTLTFSGKVPLNTHYLLGTNASFKMGDNDWLDAGEQLQIKIQGADPIIRKAGYRNHQHITTPVESLPKRNELLLPISSDQTIKVHYRWKTAVSGRAKTQGVQ